MTSSSCPSVDQWHEDSPVWTGLRGKSTRHEVFEDQFGEILRGQVAGNEEVTIRGWELFSLLPVFVQTSEGVLFLRRLEVEIGSIGGNVVGICTVGSRAETGRREPRSQSIPLHGGIVICLPGLSGMSSGTW